MNKPFIILLTGVATSGKSTLRAALKADKDLKDIKYLDMDRAALPLKNREAWRLARLEKLFAKAVNSYDRGESSLICGIGSPEEIMASPHYVPDQKIGYVLLTVPIEQYRMRIKKRVIKQLGQGATRRTYVKEWLNDHYKLTVELNARLKKSIAGQKDSIILDSGDLEPDLVYVKTKGFIQAMAEV